jgi:chromosome segregation ATPase
MMHNSEKYPEIWKAMEKARAELNQLETVRGNHLNEMKAVQQEIDELLKKKKVCGMEAKKDYDRIAELRREISRMAGAMGAITV